MADANVIKTFCPNCGTVYELDPSSIGQTATCGVCNTEFEVQDQTEYVEQTLTASAPAGEEVSAVEEKVPVVEETPAVEEEEAPDPVAEEETAPAAPKSENDDAVKMEPKSEVQTSTVKLTRVRPAPAPMKPAFNFQRNSGSAAHFAGRKISSGGVGKNHVSSAKKSFWQKIFFWIK